MRQFEYDEGGSGGGPVMSDIPWPTVTVTTPRQRGGSIGEHALVPVAAVGEKVWWCESMRAPGEEGCNEFLHTAAEKPCGWKRLVDEP